MSPNKLSSGLDITVPAVPYIQCVCKGQPGGWGGGPEGSPRPPGEAGHQDRPRLAEQGGGQGEEGKA